VLNAPEASFRAPVGSLASTSAPVSAPPVAAGASSHVRDRAHAAPAVRARTASGCNGEAPAPNERQITRAQWLSGVVITEYYPAPERWFAGRRIHAPGLNGTYAVDWLYSAHGLAMEGEGVDRGGRPAHIAELGSTAWVNAAGHLTRPVCLGKWTDGSPAWLSGGWRNARGAVTFPLAAGGWSNGTGVRTVSYGGVTFSPGSSRPLRYYHSIAVDPGLIPMGSRVYIPAYRHISGGWFIAQDTGGAIKGPHVDVYRRAPSSPSDLGRYMTHQRIYVVPPSG
jgi:3D (Asp-Asp-Asp) domain-containing protein